MKKAITLLLAICMMLTMAVPAFSAETEEITGTVEKITYVNPLYSWITEENFEEPEIPELFSNSDFLGFEEAVFQLREALKARASGFIIKCKTDEIEMLLKLDQNGNYVRDENNNIVVESGKETLGAFISKLFNAALEHTGEGNEGDYIRFSYRSYQVATAYTAVGAQVKDEFQFRFYVNYNSTAEMEEAVDDEVESLVEFLGLENKTTYQKIKSIYDYLCGNVVYASEEEMADGDKYEHSAYAALIDGEAVCQGYASAFYRLALEAGVDARCIAGLGNGGPHAWNIAKIGNYYYNLDATWDATRKEAELDYLYFLKNMEGFEDHERYGPEDDAGYPDYTSAEFNAAYPMSASDYSLSGISIIGDEGVANGYANVSVEITDGTEAAMIQFTLDFDPDELQVESCTAGAAMENLDPSINYDNEEGKIYFAWDALEGITKGGSLLDVIFRISGNAGPNDKLKIGFDDQEDLIAGTFAGKDQNGKPEYSEITTDFSGGQITVVDKIVADITGTVTMWNNSNDVVYLVYPADMADADIKADAKLADPKKDIGASVVKGTPAASGTKQYSQSFTIKELEEGEYKVAIFKPGKYVVKILPVEITGTEIDFGEQKMWLYGDITYDGRVRVGDATQIYRYLAGKRTFTDEEKLAADLSGDGRIRVGDATQIYRYLAGKSSSFDNY